MKTLIHQAAIKAEKLWDQWSPNPSSDQIFIHDYDGYSTPTGIRVRGRLLSNKPVTGPVESPSKLAAAKSMIANFQTSEHANVRVQVADVITRSDEEGYFDLMVPDDGGNITLSLPDHHRGTSVQVFRTNPAAKIGVISDIDDTIMRTGAHWLPLNLWTTLTTPVQHREVFEDSKLLLDTLHADINPVFYVSSSPWNLYRYLQNVFAANEVPEGPMFLRDFGIDDQKLLKSTHGDHKGNAIAAILASNPDLPFVLIGDSGQHDAIVYKDAIDKHPGRIRQVIIRQAGALDQEDASAASAIKQTGVDFHAGPDLSAAANGQLDLAA